MTSIRWRQQNDLKLRGIEIEKFFSGFFVQLGKFKFLNFFFRIVQSKKKSVKRTKE